MNVPSQTTSAPAVTADEAIRNRRSVRRYTDREVPDALIDEILDLARRAPSSMDGQPWHFVVVRDRTVKAKLATLKNSFCPPEKRHYTADFLADAPLLVVVCVDTSRSFGRARENGILAAGTLMLAATARGLGSVYLSAYQDLDPRLQREIGALLDLPGGVDPISLIPLGYPAESPADKSLRPLDSMIDHV